MRFLKKLGVSLFYLLLLCSQAKAIPSFDNPDAYVPPHDRFRAVVKLELTKVDNTTASCSGAVIEGAKVLTAAHCVTDQDGKPDVKRINVVFRGDDPATGAPTTTSRTTRSYKFHDSWTGSVTTSSADVAVVNLPSAPPAGAGFYRAAPFKVEPSDEYPPAVLLAGYGRSGKGGVDSTITDRPLRVGFNHYNLASKSSVPVTADISEFYGFDFDNYDPLFNRLGEPGWVTLPSGAQAIPRIDWDLDGSDVFGEVMIAKGDSGGPTIIDGIFIVGIHSWVYDGSIGADVPIPLSDLADDFQGNFGTIGFDVNVSDYADWINSVEFSPVPLPASAPLFLAALTLLGLVGIKRTDCMNALD